MGTIKKDLTGLKFGMLLVTGFSHRHTKRCGQTAIVWDCVCDCGNHVKVLSNGLIRGNSKSCGCVRKQKLRDLRLKHGMCRTRIYRIWSNMKRRCTLKTLKSYKDYGARGINVCEDWNSFESFYAWSIESGYRADLTIDRVDNNYGYSPENCRWVSMKEQANNKRNNRFLFYKGESKTMSEWSDLLGISYFNICQRLNKLGWTVEKALSTHVKRIKENISVP